MLAGPPLATLSLAWGAEDDAPPVDPGPTPSSSTPFAENAAWGRRGADPARTIAMRRRSPDA